MRNWSSKIKKVQGPFVDSVGRTGSRIPERRARVCYRLGRQAGKVAGGFGVTRAQRPGEMSHPCVAYSASATVQRTEMGSRCVPQRVFGDGRSIR